MRIPAWTKPLLKWFAQNQRPMPWRDDPSPYKVWISEIMLQQTQVATVIPYFERFVSRFPDVQSLADASPQTVLQHWEGLGYYSRARNLQAAARHISGPLNGRFPTTVAEWKELPGIGDYTAAAIASIVDAKPEPAVDGNVLRVFSRLYGIRDNITQPAIRNSFRDQLRPIIQHVDPSAFNQAMMELGALVCRPRHPRCKECAIHRFCSAYRDNLTDEIPYKPRQAPLPHHNEVAVMIRNAKGALLLYQRSETGLLGGLWAFPHARRTGKEPYRRTLMRVVEGILPASNTIDNIQKRSVIKHAFSHFSRTIHVFSCTVATTEMQSQDSAIVPCWIQPDTLKEMPLSKVDRTIANLIP